MKRCSFSVFGVLGWLLIGHIACRPSYTDVVFWPQDAVKRKATDYNVNATSQLQALRSADPVSDAENAFKHSDLRLVADRLVFPRFMGISDDQVVESLRTKYGFKVIGATETLLADEKFKRLKNHYEEQFNRKLYDLVVSSKK